MPSAANVFISYGPYEALGVVKHRTSRLQGLKALLTKDGHTVNFLKVDDWNCVEVSVNGQTVFTCDIRKLDYGSDGEIDELCILAQKKVKEAY